jgi:hypothetical protein
VSVAVRSRRRKGAWGGRVALRTERRKRARPLTCAEREPSHTQRGGTTSTFPHREQLSGGLGVCPSPVAWRSAAGERSAPSVPMQSRAFWAGPGPRRASARSAFPLFPCLRPRPLAAAPPARILVGGRATEETHAQAHSTAHPPHFRSVCRPWRPRGGPSASPYFCVFSAVIRKFLSR